MRLRQLAVLGGDGVQDLAEAFLGARLLVVGPRQHRGDRHDGRLGAAAAFGVERRGFEEILQLGRRDGEAREPVPFLAVGDTHALLEARHLVERHQAGMVVLVAGEGQALALDGVGDEAGRLVAFDALEGVEHGLHVVAGEIGHQPVQVGIVVLVEDAADAGILVEIARQRLAPARAAHVDQRRVERVGAVVDPLPQMLAVGLGEGCFQKLAVLQGDDAPADQLEHLADAAEQAVVDHAVEALAIVVDHPPQVPHVVLPAFEQRLEDVALVELGVADQRHHAAGRPLAVAQLFQAHVVLHQGGEERHGHAEADRAGREVDVVDVLGARGIGLRAAQPAEMFELVLRSDGRTGTGWRGTPARRAASPPRDPPAAAPRNRAPSSPWRARRTTPDGRRPSARRGWAAGDWRDGRSRRSATGPCARARAGASDVERERAWSWARDTPGAGKSPCVWTLYASV